MPDSTSTWAGPIRRHGDGADYASYIEATFRYEDEDVHCVLFFYIAHKGHLVIVREVTTPWVIQTIDELVTIAPAEANQPGPAHVARTSAGGHCDASATPTSRA